MWIDITKLSGCSPAIIAEIVKIARNKNPNATDRMVGLFGYKVPTDDRPEDHHSHSLEGFYWVAPLSSNTGENCISQETCKSLVASLHSDGVKNAESWEVKTEYSNGVQKESDFELGRKTIGSIIQAVTRQNGLGSHLYPCETDLVKVTPTGEEEYSALVHLRFNRDGDLGEKSAESIRQAAAWFGAPMI